MSSAVDSEHKSRTPGHRRERIGWARTVRQALTRRNILLAGMIAVGAGRVRLWVMEVVGVGQRPRGETVDRAGTGCGKQVLSISVKTASARSAHYQGE
jgi:hypothetical protein